jgi:hypothetical protein
MHLITVSQQHVARVVAGVVRDSGDVRHGSVKRVASAVGDGSIAICLAHDYLK